MSLPALSLLRINRCTGTIEQVALLELAYKISYTLQSSELSTCSFALPITDPKSSLIQPGSLVELRDSDTRIGLFKVVELTRRKDKDGVFLEVGCKDVLVTLTEKVMFSLHQFTGLNVHAVIREVLNTPEDGQPKQMDWVLDQCDFGDLVIDYLFENVTLYEALMSIPRNWTTGHFWATDTTEYPWRLSLLKTSDCIKSEIRSGKNLIDLQVLDDYQQMANRVYALGKGEGINQLNLMRAEDLEEPDAPLNGNHYVEDESSIEKYGIIETIYTDRSIERAPLLLQAAKKYLAEYADEHPTYTVKAADLFVDTRNPRDKFVVGDMCRIVDGELGIDYRGRILSVSKPDVTGSPWDVRLEIGAPQCDLYDIINGIRHQNAVVNTVSQGATNIWSRGFADNCDVDHPIKITFRLPDDLLYVNKCILDIETERYRAYEQGAASGGGDTSGSGDLTTTESGGGQTIDQSSTASSANSPAKTSTSEYSVPQPDLEDGRLLKTVWGTTDERKYYSTPHWSEYETLYVCGLDGKEIGEAELRTHWHPEMHHCHDVTLPEHNHNISHTHILPLHSHATKSHTHPLPEHVHDLTYGIYEEPTLAVSGLKVAVDGGAPTHIGLYADGLDILRFLKKSGDRIARGKHTVEIYPTSSNAGSGLCRVSGELFIQTFIQSRGDYAI